MLRQIALLAVFALSVCCILPLNMSATKTETVTYKSGDETVSGFIALPNGVGN